MTHIRLAKKSFSAAFFALLFVFVPALAQVTKENTMQWWLESKDASEFFYYHQVEPEKEVFTTDEELKFISVLDVKKQIDFHWNDILRCQYDNDGNGFTNVGSMNSNADKPSIAEGKIAPWVYSGPKPQTPAECFLESNVSASVGYGVIKTQKVISDSFRIE